MSNVNNLNVKEVVFFVTFVFPGSTTTSGSDLRVRAAFYYPRVHQSLNLDPKNFTCKNITYGSVAWAIEKKLLLVPNLSFGVLAKVFFIAVLQVAAADEETAVWSGRPAVKRLTRVQLALSTTGADTSL